MHPSTVIRSDTCSKKNEDNYVVTEMDSEAFLDFKHMAAILKNLTVDERNEKLKWRNIKQNLFFQKS